MRFVRPTCCSSLAPLSGPPPQRGPLRQAMHLALSLISSLLQLLSPALMLSARGSCGCSSSACFCSGRRLPLAYRPQSCVHASLPSRPGIGLHSCVRPPLLRRPLELPCPSPALSSMPTDPPWRALLSQMRRARRRLRRPCLGLPSHWALGSASQDCRTGMGESCARSRWGRWPGGPAAVALRHHCSRCCARRQTPS